MTGAVLLGVIFVVAVSDMLLALYFRSLAKGARWTAPAMFVAAPVMSLAIVLIFSGVIPSGIEPVRF
ncbi:hypothetical protein [Sphingomonas agri]|uniref:hypothetical protein n=1 Tax=Sphingomonas agri TaxID=1813878 RepID=UPI00311D4A5C